MACPILSQLESRGAPGNSVVAAARVRAPRRRQDWPGKHHGSVRSRTDGRRRRPGTGRSPLTRRNCRRPSRRDARSHHARDGARSRTGRLQSSRRSTCRRSATCSRATRRHRHHHRVEGGGPRARDRRCGRGAASRRDRPRVSGFVQPLDALRAARARGARQWRRAARDSRCGSRCTNRGASCHPAALRTGRFRFPKPAARRASCHRDSSSSLTKPASRCRCGPSTSLRIFGDY